MTAKFWAIPVYQPKNKKVVAIASGGMDSTTLLYQLKDAGNDVLVLSFDYGQRHKKELQFIKRTCDKLGFKHEIVDITSITNLISNSTLTSDAPVPDGHFRELSMKQTVVPNRNAIMLSIAVGAAANIRAFCVATAVHGGDHFIYPDCRPYFMQHLSNASVAACQDLYEDSTNFAGIFPPYIDEDKAYIAKRGNELGVEWLDTWSCYKGGEIHCGKCGTCVERREAFALANVEDPTEYEDRDFAWEAIANYKEKNGDY